MEKLSISFECFTKRRRNHLSGSYYVKVSFDKLNEVDSGTTQNNFSLNLLSLGRKLAKAKIKFRYIGFDENTPVCEVNRINKDK